MVFGRVFKPPVTKYYLVASYEPKALVIAFIF